MKQGGFQTANRGAFVIPNREDWNAVARSGKGFAQQGQGASPTGRPPNLLPSQTIVYVRNDSESDVARFGILGIDDFLITPTDNLAEFQRLPMVAGVTPSAADHAETFVIALEPIAAGKIGRAVVAGVVQALIAVTDESHRFATVKDGDGTKLASSDGGHAHVLVKESGTGDKWALIRIGASHGVRYAKVIANKTEANGTYTSIFADGKLASHCTASPCDADGENVTDGSGTAIILKLNELPGARFGYSVAANNIVAYLPATGDEQVPGAAAGTFFDGYVIHAAGGDGDADGDGGARIDIGRYAPFPITLVQTGGAAGSDVAACSFTYTVTDTMTTTSLGTNVNPSTSPNQWKRRTLGAMVAADMGLAHFNVSGQLCITWINEHDDNEACETSE